MAVDAEEAGMDAFMNKPFKLEELAALYVKILERHNRKQRDISTRQITATPGVDTISIPLETIVCGPRSICNVTPNAKIFVDASELDGMITSQMCGDSLSLEQDGTLPAAAVAVLECTVASMGEKTGHLQLPAGKHNSGKVHVVN